MSLFRLFIFGANSLSRLSKLENINEDLKSHDQLAWVQAMNNIKNRAEEIVYNEIIFS